MSGFFKREETKPLPFSSMEMKKKSYDSVWWIVILLLMIIVIAIFLLIK